MSHDRTEYSGTRRRVQTRRSRLWIAWLGALAFLPPVPAAAQADLGETDIPVVRFHLQGAAELLEMVYPDRYPPGSGRLAEDVDRARDRAERLIEWWEGQGQLYLQRLTDFGGLPWPYRQIDVYLARYWPVVSIEHPLVLAVEAIRVPGGREVPVPEPTDVRILLLAHQLAHYLLDDPEFLPDAERAVAYEHPLMRPGNFAVEALVNWLVYRTLEDLWGADRLRAATRDEIWQAYNPSHGFVVDELQPRARLSRLYTLADWLSENPEDSEIFRVRQAYLRQAAEGPGPAVGGLAADGGHGIGLGATFEGRVVIANVDEGTPAAIAGLLQGDALLTVEGRPAGTDVIAAQDALDASWEANREINLSVERAGQELFFSIEDN